MLYFILFHIFTFFSFFLQIFMLEVATSKHLFISSSEGTTSFLLRLQHLSFLGYNILLLRVQHSPSEGTTVVVVVSSEVTIMYAIFYNFFNILFHIVFFLIFFYRSLG